ncbi:MAG: OmpA family protein [Syntrophobacteraceae bacterium]
MSRNSRLWRMIVPIIALTVFMGVADASAQCAPKVDNFYIFVDQSGSMFQRYIKLDMVKMVAAKKLVERMDTMIPDLGYKGGIDLFADFLEVLPLTPYRPGGLTPSLVGIRDDKKIFGRETPMKTGILELADKALLDKVVGPVTVIMLTDGMASPGEDPLGVVKQLVDRFPRVAFHVISFAQPGVKDPRLIKDKGADLKAETKGQETNQQLAKLGHGQFVEAATLFNDKAAMQSFLNNVFCAKEKIILRGIQFDFDKYNIKPEYEPILDEAVDQLKKWIYQYKLVITGHTDDQGTADYNQKLSERRANSVMEYFVKKGIPAASMKAVGQGFKVPIASNKTEEGRALNRRVELDLLQ